MLVLQKDEHVTGQAARPWCGGYSCSAPQHPALQCPPAPQSRRRKRLQGSTWDPAARSLGATARPEPNPQQGVSYERRTSLEAKGSCLVGL